LGSTPDSPGLGLGIESRRGIPNQPDRSSGNSSGMNSSMTETNMSTAEAEIKLGHYQCPTCLCLEVVPLNVVQPTPPCEDCLCEMELMLVTGGNADGGGESQDGPGTRPHKLRVAAGEVVGDIRSGMTDPELMVKYQTSSKGLQKLFRRLVEVKVVSHTEIYERSPAYRAVADIISSRRFPRIDITFPLFIIDTESRVKGLVRDISESGLRVAGIETKIGDVRTFRLSLDELIPADPLLFQTRCRWVKTKGRNSKYPVAGQEITDISEDALRNLQNFVRLFYT